MSSSSSDLFSSPQETPSHSFQDHSQSESQSQSQSQSKSQYQHRRSSRIPGGFDDEDDHNNYNDPDQDEVNNKLMDVESSFLPEPSTLENNRDPSGKDDTFLFGVPTKPADTLATPNANTSALEHLSSPPSGVARTVSRMQSLATMASYGTASEDTDLDLDLPSSPSKRPDVPTITSTDADAETKPDADANAGAGAGADTKNAVNLDNSNSNNTDPDDATPKKPQQPPPEDTSDPSIHQSSKRPKYLRSRSSVARLSYDSMASSNTDASDATLGADFALQSGGALPDSNLAHKTAGPLSRQASLGSLMSDDDNRPAGSSNHLDLSKIDEESPGPAFHLSNSNSDLANGDGNPITPKASASNLIMPTDTVIAKNVRDIEVPGTFARQYLQERNQSPSRALSLAGMATPGPKRGLTLKEHRSTVEKLGKENFDLKMKIHFLDQALQKRSEDGVKEMITENVQLKSDRMRLEKDNFNLRKQVRELQRKLNEARDSPSADPGYGTDDDRSLTTEEELFYLRERIETNESEIEKLRAESLAKESEKRRLAEMVRSLGDARAASSDVGSREERDMWKDMLEAETIAREQSEEENKKLRDEIARLKHDSLLGTGRALSRKGRGAAAAAAGAAGAASLPLLSRSSSVERNNELERLRHEVSELQKTISAQASALTSRNKEKERLYQEIEDLKLGRMGGGGGSGARSIAGDSILDRSASRARSHSRISNNGPRFSPLSDQERDSLESKINDFRDQVSQLKLANTTLQNELDEAIAELDAVDAQAQADADQFNEELRLLTQERDNALRDAEEQDQAFQQLKNEAQEEIDGLGDELDAKVEECERLEHELRTNAQTVHDLQAEIRSMAEGLRRLEEDAQNNLARYESVRAELNDATRDLENMESNLNDAQSRIQRMTVQQESHYSQIAFLREEQDADKIKISDFESLLKKTHINLESERQRSADLQRRLEEERQQREMLTSKKEKDVQKMITDLNREASSAKEELRNIRKTLAARETDLTSTRDRLNELENNLRHIVNDPAANSRSLINAVTKMQVDLAQATTDLDSTRSQLNEREALLASRDQLLESSSLECRKLQDTLERERQARSQDKHSFEQALKSHQASARALTQNRNKVAELENARNSDRKRLAQHEQQFKEQLAERNQVLLSLWKKLSAMCGPDWAHNNSLINGNLPSQEVVGNMLFWPGFSRNLLLAAKQVEGTVNAFRDKIKRVDRELYKDYQNLEHILDLRLKKLERIEASWEQIKLKMVEQEHHHHHSHQVSGGGAADARSTKSGKSIELSRLKGENRLLRAELQLVQSRQQQQHQQHQHQHQPSLGQSQHMRYPQRTESRRSESIDSQAPSFETAVHSSGSGSGVFGIGPRSSSIRRGRTRVPPSSSSSPHRQERGVGGGSMIIGSYAPERTNIVEHLANFTNNHPTAADYPSPIRSNSVTSANSKHSYSTTNTATGFAMQDRREGLIIPAGPFNAPANGNFGLPPTQLPTSSRDVEDGAVASSAAGPGGGYSLPPSSSGGGGGSGPGQEKWIHRLRELERRLKQEREARLLDRSGMRRRLEERDAVNEELRAELERERVRNSYDAKAHELGVRHREIEGGDVVDSSEVDEGT